METNEVRRAPFSANASLTTCTRISSSSRRVMVRGSGLAPLLLALLIIELVELGDLHQGQEAVLAQADVDERAAQAFDHVLDPALVDAADQGLGFGPLDVELDQLVVLNDGDPRLPFIAGQDDLRLNFHQSSTRGIVE